jgi:hypothetical protein
LIRGEGYGATGHCLGKTLEVLDGGIHQGQGHREEAAGQVDAVVHAEQHPDTPGKKNMRIEQNEKGKHR